MTDGRPAGTDCSAALKLTPDRLGYGIRLLCPMAGEFRIIPQKTAMKAGVELFYVCLAKHGVFSFNGISRLAEMGTLSADHSRRHMHR